MFRLVTRSSLKVNRVAPIFHSARRGFVVTASRWNSSAPVNPEKEKKQAIKAALEARDELQRDWDAKELTYEELKPKTMSPSDNLYLIDVREQDEVMQGMIPSAVHIPLPAIPEALKMRQNEFRAKFGFELPRKDQELIFYCRSGKRAASAADLAKRAGYTKIWNYKGSWMDWVEREGKA